MPPADAMPKGVREQLERVLANRGFARNERMSRFLRFVVEGQLEGRPEELKESVIAIEVFGRKPDPNKQDSIVRTEASRLRARLAEYYAADGRGDPVIIELPKGGYAPRFIQVEPDVPRPRPAKRWRKVAAALFLAAAVAAGAWWWIARRSGTYVIAVLPLENLSPDHANDYFTDGLTDEIIRNLSLIEGLTVRSRASSFALKGKPRDMREVGKELDAGYVLDGSVFRDGSKLRVNAELVRVRDNVPLWSGKFDRDLSDAFAIQDEISRRVVNELRLKIGKGRRRYETSPEAYDLYLRALALSRLGAAPRQYPEAVALFNQVISQDSAFAPAHAALAVAYGRILMEFAGTRSRDLVETERAMRAAAQKALQLDPLLAEAYDAMGMVYAREHEWAEAEKNFRRSLDLDANRSPTYVHYAMDVMLPLGRVDEVQRQLRAAEKADPLAPDVHHMFALALLCMDRYGEAADHCQRALAIDPQYSRARQALARARLFQGKTEEAVRMFDSREGTPSPGYRGFAYARVGRREEAEKLAAAVAGRPQNELLIYAGLGDKDRAFDALERLAASGDGRAILYLPYPELAVLRGDPRMKTFRRKMRLPN
jgi:TolB-like protein